HFPRNPNYTGSPSTSLGQFVITGSMFRQLDADSKDRKLRQWCLPSYNSYLGVITMRNFTMRKPTSSFARFLEAAPAFVALAVFSPTAPAADTLPTVTTRSASALGRAAMTVNGSIHPHGLPTTYYFEYGPTTAYGSKTAVAPLPPRLA